MKKSKTWKMAPLRDEHDLAFLNRVQIDTSAVLFWWWWEWANSSLHGHGCWIENHYSVQKMCAAKLAEENDWLMKLADWLIRPS